MKKDLLFIIPIVIIWILIFELKLTGMTVHIIAAGLGLLILIAYAVATKKEWKSPVLEILYRVCYAVALITGIVLMKVDNVAAVAVVHKVSAALFACLLVATETHKGIKR